MSLPGTIHGLTTLAQRAMVLALVGATSALSQSLGKNADHAAATRRHPPEWKNLDGNSINCTIASDGPYADYRKTNNAGMEWPSGSGMTPVFCAGIWFIGYHAPTGALRTAQMDYGTEYQPGPLLTQFNTTTNDDWAAKANSQDPRYRAYKIDRFAPDGDSRHGLDPWSEWPGDLGAPSQDVNANGIWDPMIDLPEFTGRQMVWTVFNDANYSLHAALGATAPMGIEVQCLYSAFNLRGPLDSAIVIRWRIFNRSDADYQEVYLGLWSDVDLGDANDDLPGCDTTLDLGFVYNGDSLDGSELYGGPSHAYDSLPPAIGFQLLQGPKIPGTSDDSARFYSSWRAGYKNLRATSIITPGKTSFLELVDPPDGHPEYPGIAYDYLLGKAGTVHRYLLRPDGTVNLYWFSGDPVAGTGDLPENFVLGEFRPQDLRILVNTGPFALARGDTQEVVAAVFLARGRDYLHSVTKLKEHGRYIRAMFENDYRFLNVPSQPGGSDIREDFVPAEFVLRQNYPNPFNPATTLEYELPEPAGITICVFDCFGRDTRTLVQAQHPSGLFSVKWDGRDRDARQLASGVYFARFEALLLDGSLRIFIRKMILVR